jgi:hypothetical protein
MSPLRGCGDRLIQLAILRSALFERRRTYAYAGCIGASGDCRGPSSGEERPPQDDSGEKQVPPCSLRSRVGMTRGGKRGNSGKDGTFRRLSRTGSGVPTGHGCLLVHAFPPVELAGYFRSSLRDLVSICSAYPGTTLRLRHADNPHFSRKERARNGAPGESKSYCGCGGNSSQRWWRRLRAWGPSSGKGRPPQDDSGKKQVPPCSLRSRVGMTR